MVLIDVTPGLGPALLLTHGLPLLARGALLAVTGGLCAITGGAVLGSRRRTRSRS
ncbi:MAG TPA: hypothetical protein VK428_09580 [Acidimicrobiales bacterium]|nr:hypothetical protein [Acidimicrobiales bacterium]